VNFLHYSEQLSAERGNGYQNVLLWIFLLKFLGHFT